MLKRAQVSFLRDVFCVRFVPRYGTSSAIDALVMPADEELKQAGFPCKNTSHDFFIREPVAKLLQRFGNIYHAFLDVGSRCEFACPETNHLSVTVCIHRAGDLY